MTTKDVLVPDIGGAENIDVIEVLVSAGDEISAEQSLITLEGDKATMEIPSPYSGVVEKVALNVGDKVSEGSLILTMKVTESAATKIDKPAEKKPEPSKLAPQKQSATPMVQPAFIPQVPDLPPAGAEVHASPGVRRIAHEFGVDLRKVRGSGRKGRILKTDVQAFVKAALAGAFGGGGLTVAPAPKVDHAKFGEISTEPLSKINKLTGAVVHRSWVTIPHVTQFGDADITEMEAFRQKNKAKAEEKGVKLTPLVFIMKAVVASLKAFPRFNSSLDDSGENLILKKYFHLGIAADTPNGLVVPVIRDVDKKTIYELADELAKISAKAREVGLTPAEMAGSCFTISSLGGIGGTAFTPIVKAPDVAILGVSRSDMKPVYQEGQFIPRLMLPLSLSYDHRVIDGADGARFIVDLAKRLADIESVI